MTIAEQSRAPAPPRAPLDSILPLLSYLPVRWTTAQWIRSRQLCGSNDNNMWYHRLLNRRGKRRSEIDNLRSRPHKDLNAMSICRPICPAHAVSKYTAYRCSSRPSRQHRATSGCPLDRSILVYTVHPTCTRTWSSSYRSIRASHEGPGRRDLYGSLLLTLSKCFLSHALHTRALEAALSELAAGLVLLQLAHRLGLPWLIPCPP